MTAENLVPPPVREAFGLRTIRTAFTRRERLRGLLGVRALPPGEALLIAPCSAVHTVGMAFSLDLVFLDRQDRVVRIVRDVPPGRLCVWGGFRSHCVLEFASAPRSGAEAQVEK